MGKVLVGCAVFAALAGADSYVLRHNCRKPSEPYWEVSREEAKRYNEAAADYEECMREYSSEHKEQAAEHRSAAR